jgi:BlaI family transcriptional regulator, penicillinase repressor
VPRPTSATLTDGELRLMQVLWDKGQSTVGQVVAALTTPKPAYNTVLTLLNIMEKKGFVTHRKDGRAFVYIPVIGRADASRNALKSLINRFFEGSPGLLMLNLIKDEQLSPEALKELKERVQDEDTE